MRMDVMTVWCDRCGKAVVEDDDYCKNTLSVETDVPINGNYLVFDYQELCRRCHRTVLRRIMEAGPLKGAPKGKVDE